MPKFKLRDATARHRPLWGNRLVAAVPAVLDVEPTPDDAEPLDYDLRLNLDIVAGRLACIELCAHRREGGPVVTSENLRRIPVGRYVTLAAIDLELVHEVRTAAGGFELVPFEPPPSDFAAAGMTDEALREITRLYVWAAATGERPYGLLERDYSLPRAKAARWLATARRRGILDDDGS